MKTVLTFVLMGFGIIVSHAQTGIGTNNPDNSAQLDITSAKRGLLIPRVALVEVASQLPIVGTPAESLLVYNITNNASVTQGFYYWSSEKKWVKMTTGENEGGSQVADFITTSIDYEVKDADYTIVASKLTNDITITLPAATASKGRVLVINQLNGTDAAGKELTVKFNVPVVYSDAVSKSELMAPYYSATGGSLKITLQSDGLNWHVISAL
ncbi:hypothetical protein [Flavobacterium sp. N1736]|uniref:hypothetical protein n=1 Tax=Flavobacterium sp. N1736 TaxID=2986823 RepID=UPI0022249E23|nr:hypothetical protein [Flavobacterium sp. N1736]